MTFINIHSVMIGDDGKVWELINVEVFTPEEMAEQIENFTALSANIHLVIQPQYELEYEYLFDYAAGTTPVNDNYYEGH